MTAALESILEAALELTLEEQALLIEELQDRFAMSLPDDQYLNKDVERAWEAEIARRLEANPDGKGNIQIEEALQRLEDLIQK